MQKSEVTISRYVWMQYKKGNDMYYESQHHVGTEFGGIQSKFTVVFLGVVRGKRVAIDMCQLASI